MPAVTVYYPQDFFPSNEAKTQFKAVVKDSAARTMDAIDPKTDTMTQYGVAPDDFIDLIMVPLDPDDMDTTTPLVATIVTYAWPDRMDNLAERLAELASDVKTGTLLRSMGDETISFTFLGKQPGAWIAI